MWGFEALLPLQGDAIRAGIEQRDSLIVMPTGAGKSLCYQVPPLITGRTDIVISPLIALMKDQVDGLNQTGYPAAALHSGLDASEQRAVKERMDAGDIRLLFMSPERIVRPESQEWLSRAGVSSFAIDEAHCISQWGHQFRPEYRQLASLRGRFPEASFHAYTATATPRVRDDVVGQLALRNPRIIVGSVDRPNLVYRIQPKTNPSTQVLEIIRRHPREAAIVYCLSRKETEKIAAELIRQKVRAAVYHAGLTNQKRTAAQNLFDREEIDVVVATVAFGMGIDRSNVRCVIHVSMPKSVEQYQQETGRAGRDGLEAECVLLYSGADAHRWERLIRMSAAEAEVGAEVIDAQIELLRHMQNLAGSVSCRHHSLVKYFGQTYGEDNCHACDVCRGEIQGMDGATVVAQKIISCVARTEERFGVGYVVDVLRGSESDAIRRNGAEELSTYGLLRDEPKNAVQSWTYQLIDQGIIDRTEGDRPTLQLNEKSWEVLRGEREVLLAAPAKKKVSRSADDLASWEGVDEGLFDHLRGMRRNLSQERSVPAYIIFSDRTLRALSAEKPATKEELNNIPGIGEKKLADLGDRVLEAISLYEKTRQGPDTQESP